MSFYKKTYNEKFGVWYPTAVTVGQPVPVKKLAKRLSQMCTVTYADVMAVLGGWPASWPTTWHKANLSASTDWAPSATRSPPRAWRQRMSLISRSRCVPCASSLSPLVRGHRPKVPYPPAAWCLPASSGCPMTRRW